jgi:ApaG protein
VVHRRLAADEVHRLKSQPVSERLHDIRITAETHFLPEQSAPERNQYVFAYTITITNEGAVAARLLSRHWVITDSNGKIQEVRGLGVVGEQPHLKPGESFRYTSGASIETPFGTMHGSYQMIADNGIAFDAPIAAFRLSVPTHTLH